MSDETPFYQRTLDSFADHIITRARPYDGGWHAVLDCGFRTEVADPDFSPHGYGRTKEEAAQKSAQAIRNDALGIGKYAPHSIVVPGYDLHFRLMKHWELKERFEKVGVDPSEMYFASDSISYESDWKLAGRFLDVVQEKRVLEFSFRLYLAEVGAEVQAGATDIADVGEQVLARIKDDLNDVGWRSRPTDETWKRLEERIEEYLASQHFTRAPAM